MTVRVDYEDGTYSQGPRTPSTKYTWEQITYPVDNSKQVKKIGVGSGAKMFMDDVSLKGPTTPIPEFSTMAIPVIAVIGLMLLFQRRKGK
jgi:hypothetical protein